MPTQRLTPEIRREQILAAAVELAKSKGYSNITREDVAAKAGCSIGLVTLRFSTMEILKKAVMNFAVKNGVLEIICQGLMLKNRTALGVPDKIKKAAVATVIG